MITYQRLCQHPRACLSLTGLTPSGIESLFAAFFRADQQRRRSPVTRTGKERQRAPGAGRHHALDERTRLVMALVWLRVYPTYEVLAFLFSLHQTNALRNVSDVLDTLLTLCDFAFETPGPDRKPLSSAAAVMDAFPDVALVIDAKEQKVQRPTGKENQRPYYSGKKRMPTIKNQVAVSPSGHIEHVSGSVPGGTTHDLTLLRESGLLDELDKEHGAMLDEGYQGVKKDRPDVPLHLPHRKRQGLSEEQRRENQHLNRYRIVVEHTIAQMNVFQTLSQTYRHDKDQHTRTVRVVSMLVNRRIEQHPLKTYQTNT